MDLEKLKQLAQAATPGPCLDPGHYARYIAAAHPQTVLELIAEVERLRAENDRLKASPPASHVIPANPPLGPVVSGSMG